MGITPAKTQEQCIQGTTVVLYYLSLKWDEIVTFVRALQSLNAAYPIDVILDGIEIFDKLWHPSKA